MASLPAFLTVYFVQYVPRTAAGECFTFKTPWVPAAEISLTFSLDGLSLLFALLISGIGTLVCIYSGDYLKDHPQRGRFFCTLFLFMGSMLGVVLADHGIVLFVFWELTSISSYLLIGFDHRREAARSAALQALLVTGAGGLALLAGLILLGQAGGSMELSTLTHQGEAIRSHPLHLAMFLLILVGAFTKSAQFPFHFWLPNAMEAPTPVSTYLHSATMVKAGIYLLARLAPIWEGAPIWSLVLVPVGGLTLLTGAALALVQTDLKRLLAHTTVSALGIMTLLLGIGSVSALQAATAFLLAHALYKGALFLVVGILDHEAGTREVTELGGLRRAMPFTALAAALAALSSAGFPPFLGFLAKEGMYGATLQAPQAWLPTGMVLVASVSFVAAAGLVGFKPFLGPKVITSRTPREASFSLWIAPLTAATLGLLLGLLPGAASEYLIIPALSAIHPGAVSAPLALWHGFDIKLLLSGTVLLLGTAVYFRWPQVCRGLNFLNASGGFSPSRWYAFGLEALYRVSRFQTRILQSGHLHLYLLIVILTTIGLVGSSLLDHDVYVGLGRWKDIRPHEAILVAVILAATVMVVRSPSRLAAVVALGVVGYGVAMIFLLFSAPDLAMTQLSIETLSVILLVLVIFRLPPYSSYSNKLERIRDAGVALTAGALMTALILAATALQREARLVDFFAKNTLELAQGRNVVNVILVDFRGFDTLGEITVLSVAAIGVYALLKLKDVRTNDRTPGND